MCMTFDEMRLDEIYIINPRREIEALQWHNVTNKQINNRPDNKDTSDINGQKTKQQRPEVENHMHEG